MKHGLFIFLLFFSVNLFAQNENLHYSCETKVRWAQIEDVGDLRVSVKPLISYEYDNAWGEAKLRFYNYAADTFNGKIHVQVDKAMVGYRLDAYNDTEFYIEVGRNALDSMFESKLQYNSYFNGMHFCIKKDNFKFHGGPFVSNTYLNYFGAVGEVTFENIKQLPISFTYSLTNWYPAENSVVSQITGKYHFMNIVGHPLTIYGAFLHNHYSRAHSNGCYVGAKLGKIAQAKDYFLDINYQYVGSLCIPYFDSCAIAESAMEAKVAYAFTDHFTLEGKFVMCTTPRAEVSAIFNW